MKKHLTPNGPADCKAAIRGCPYESTGHFSNEADAEKAYADLMSHGHTKVLQKSNRNQRLKNVRESILNRIEISGHMSFTLDELESLGESLSSEVFERTCLDPSRYDFSRKELGALGEMNSAVLREIQNSETPSLSIFRGPHSVALRESIAVLPSGAVSLVVNDVYTEMLRDNTRKQEGFHIAQAVVMGLCEADRQTVDSIPQKAIIGDFVLDSKTTNKWEVEDEDLEGFAVKRVERPLGKPLEAGESAIPAMEMNPRTEDKLIGLIGSGILDGSGRLQAGHELDFIREAPEYAKSIESTALTSRLYAGKKPSGPIAKGKKYVKIADSFQIRDTDGGFYSISKPLYEIHEKSISYNAHTIGAKREVSQSEHITVLTHEFTHAIQTAAKIPGEKEIFQKISAGKPAKNVQSYRYHEGFPDEYMGDQAGREVFTRATEGIFYPHYADYPYLYNESQNSKEVRNWAMGAWAVLALHGEMIAKEKRENSLT